MTRGRIYGEDTPFSAWMRRQPALDSIAFHLYSTDRDFTNHSYRDNVDGLGPRRVQLMQAIEVKTRGGMPNDFQRQTKFFEHQLLNQKRRLRCCLEGDTKCVWHFGYHILSLPGEDPDEFPLLTWVSFDASGALRGRTIPTADLVRILGFQLRPDTLEPLRLRRHHAGIVEIVTVPLGFTCERLTDLKA
jgi:hypothetical protein